MNAADSSCRTWTNRILWARSLSASITPLIPSPGKPKTTSTPQSWIASINRRRRFHRTSPLLKFGPGQTENGRTHKKQIMDKNENQHLCLLCFLWFLPVWEEPDGSHINRHDVGATCLDRSNEA